MQNIRLISLWSKPRKQNETINCHIHKYNELVYYKYGNGKTKIGNKTYCFSEDSFCLIPANIEHSEIHNSDCEVICLEFAYCENISAEVISDISNEVYNVLKQLLNEIREQKNDFKKMIELQLNVLFLHISRIQKSTAKTKDFSYIINYLTENFHEKIYLSQCAKELNISYDYFQHKFKEITGYSPQQFLIEQRLLHAEKMLKEGKYSCTEIAFRCGFCTSAQFSAQFKNSRGITPLKYKKA